MGHTRINRNARLSRMCYGRAPSGSAAAGGTRQPNGSAAAGGARQPLSRAYTTTLLR